MAIVVVNGKWREATAPMQLPEAVELAKQTANWGNTAQVYKLEESHFFKPKVIR